MRLASVRIRCPVARGPCSCPALHPSPRKASCLEPQHFASAVPHLPYRSVGTRALAGGATPIPYHRDMTAIRLHLGDITTQAVDAIVNAANSSLMGGGGVDGAIHRAGGPAIVAQCKLLRVTRYPEGLPPGQAVATTAGALPARWVIHTVGPVYTRARDQSDVLASCHVESLRVADQLGARSVSFPAISTGAYGYPVDEAAEIALRAVRETSSNVKEITFVLFDERTYAAFADAAER